MNDDPTAVPLPELPGVDVQEIIEAMRADGVNLSDPAGVRRWLAGTGVDTSGPPGSAEDTGDGDFEDGDFDDGDFEDEFDGDYADVSMKELFGLPDRLPPLRLPSDAELAAAARGSQLLARARLLAGWVAERCVLVDDDGPNGADCLALAAHLGIETDGDVAGLADVPELAHLWQLAEGIELISIGDKDATRGVALVAWPDGDDEEVLDLWATALAVVMTSLDLDSDFYLDDLGQDHSEQHDLDFYGAGGAVLMALSLARGGGAPRAELSEMVRESCDSAASPAGWERWVAEQGDPVQVLLGRFDELGAVMLDDESARLTPLAQWAMWAQLVDSDVEVPILPPVAEMSAAELVAAAEGFTEEELAEEVEAWLALRAPEDAAGELLDAAAHGDPVDRMYATSLVSTQIGDQAQPRWRSALDDHRLAPYAKLALGMAPEQTDLAWLLTDVLAATSGAVGLDDAGEVADMGEERARELAMHLADAVPAGQEREMFEVMWRLPHPSAVMVLTLLGTYHPDKQVAKAARKAAFKAASRESQA